MSTVTPRPEERWLATSLPVRRASATMALVAVGSLALHVVFVGATAVAARAPAPTPQEITVEIVQDVPKAEKAPEPAKVAEAAKPEPIKTEPPRVDPRPEPLKAEAAKSQPKPEAAKPPPPAREAQAERKLAQLQNELESLKAEQAQLQAEREQAAARQSQPVALRDTGMGVLPDTFQAIALPASTDGQGDAASYEAVVFSALAKAKGIGGEMGLPGHAGVQFSVDAAGKLVDVVLVHRSGVAALDTQAIDTVRRAAPFPPPPQGAQRSFVANFNFETRTAR